MLGTVFYGSLLAGDTYTRAFQLSLLFLAIVAVTVAMLVQLLPRTVRPVETEPEGAAVTA